MKAGSRGCARFVQFGPPKNIKTACICNSSAANDTVMSPFGVRRCRGTGCSKLIGSVYSFYLYGAAKSNGTQALLP